MKKRLLSMLALSVALIIFTGCQPEQSKDPFGLEGKTHAAVTPAEQTAPWAVSWWMPRHEQVLQQVAQGNVDMIFVGDSITHGWENSGRETWQEYYAPHNAVNMGFSGDQTQHVLWRLDNGEIEGINPKLAVIMIGTNNSNGEDFTAEEIADGIKAICSRIRTKLPETKILILATFPRGEGPSPQREKNAQASQLASEIADNKKIFYLDINQEFLEEDGTLTREMMPDLLHPRQRGYKIWAEAMEPTIVKLMGEK